METLEIGIFNQAFLDRWYSHFHQFETYTRQKGAPPSHAGEAGVSLMQWMRIQRGMQQLLPAELKNKLTALKFDFEAQEITWEQRCQQLADFARRNGHTCLPTDEPALEGLQDWLIRQIHNQKFLSESQYHRLDGLGVDWEMAATRDHRWEFMFLKLKDFRTMFGHSRVPQAWEKDKPLAAWVSVQRRTYAAHKMRPDRQRRLEEQQFIWNMQATYESQWEQRFQELALFYKTHGHCSVPGKMKKLTSWIENQRTSSKQNLLPAAREEKLNAIGFVWNCSQLKVSSWNERYRQLKNFKQAHGHCLVPVNWKENKPLGQWVSSQRRRKAKNQLAPDKKEKLTCLGFVWSPDTLHQLKSNYDQQWQASFEKLKAYQQAHGSCQVSLKIDPKLQHWTRWQRTLHFQGKLTEARTRSLQAIDFPWNIQEGYWMKMYQALTHFYDLFGHTRVYAAWPPNRQLAAWVYHTKKNSAMLSAHQLGLLNKIGFDWVQHPKTMVAWEVMYGRLVDFKQQHGHTRVPARWPADPKLSKWVSRMRYEKEVMLPQRASLLTQISFDWGCRLSPVYPTAPVARSKGQSNIQP